MNPYSLIPVVHSDKPKAAGSTASRIALSAFVVAILHLMFFASWMIYDLVLGKTGGCFTGDGLFELLVLGLSFTTFSLVSLFAAVKARKWRLVIVALCFFAPVALFLVTVFVRFSL